MCLSEQNRPSSHLWLIIVYKNIFKFYTNFKFKVIQKFIPVNMELVGLFQRKLQSIVRKCELGWFLLEQSHRNVYLIIHVPCTDPVQGCRYTKHCSLCLHLVLACIPCCLEIHSCLHKLEHNIFSLSLLCVIFVAHHGNA